MRPDLREYLAWARTLTYRGRLDRARRECERAATLGSLVVSTSWGKDSTALCDIALDTLGRVPLMHIASTYELPGGSHVVEHFRSRTLVHEVPAARSLVDTIDWLRTYGLGYERETLRAAGKQRKATAGIAWTIEHGFGVQALGMRAQESKARRTCFRVRGLTYPAHGLLVSNPIGWWSVRDVWARIAERGLPYHRLYDAETHGMTRETLRNSGWLTMPSAETDARATWLRRHFPEQWRLLAAACPQVRLLV